MTKTKKTSSFIRGVVQLLVIFGLLVGIVFLMMNIYSSIQKYRAVNKEISELKSEADEFDRENKKLHKLVEYFSSEDFQEKEIKEKLNLVKKGERVVFVQDNIGGVTKDVTETKPEVKIEHANYYYWWQYFFGKW